MSRLLKCTKSEMTFDTTSYFNTRGPRYFFKLFTSYTFILYILCFNIMNIVTVKKGSLVVFSYQGFYIDRPKHVAHM